MPMIFKGDVAHAHGGRQSFSPGFGVRMADAIQASCSAYPFFKHTEVKTDNGEHIKLIDGGYCANNPSLYALADANAAMGYQQNNIRLLSLGVGISLEPTKWQRLVKRLRSVQLFQKTLKIKQNLWTNCDACFIVMYILCA